MGWTAWIDTRASAFACVRTARLLLFFGCLLGIGSGLADPSRAGGPFDPKSTLDMRGYIPTDPADLTQMPQASLTRAYIPEAIDLTPLMPRPVNQKHGSCVSYAVAYATRGYYSALENQSRPGDPDKTPSPAYLHSLSHAPEEPCNKAGSNAGRAIKFMTQFGLVPLSAAPTEKICSPELKVPVPPNGFSVAGGERIFPLRSVKEKVTDAVIDTIKQKLAKGHPVLAAFDLFKARADKDDATTTLALLDASEVYQGSLGKQFGNEGGHQMVIVGYDDRRSAFLLQNSWGPYWASGGFGWISYAATKADLHDALVMKTGTPPPVPVPSRPSLSQLSAVEPVGSCSYLSRTRVEGRDAYDGFIETIADLAQIPNPPDYLVEEMLQPLPTKHLRLAVRPWPTCEAFAMLRIPMEAPSRPGIAMTDNRSIFRVGEVMSFQVTTPNFPAFVYIAYLQADGSVVNLLPRRSPIRTQMPPGTVLRFGDGKDGRQTFRATAPLGAEAVIAIASRSPISQLEDLEAGGNGQYRMEGTERGADGKRPADRVFLSRLRAGLLERPDEAALAREVTADVVHLTIAE